MSLVLVSLTHENKHYNTWLTPKQVEEISADPQKYEDLVKKLNGNKENEEKNLESAGPSSSCVGLSSELDGSLEQKTSILRSETGTNQTNKSFKWYHESTILLINLRLGMEKEFNKPTCKKSKLWQNISFEMRNIGNYNVSAADCDNKYRNLLQTYRNNKEKIRKTGEGKITWEYFESFDNILGHKASSAVPKELLGSTTQLLSKGDSEMEVSEDSEGIVDEPRKKKQKPEKSKNELSLQQYLFLKNQREEQQWKDKKELKMQEINAISNLAEAIRGNKS